MARKKQLNTPMTEELLERLREKCANRNLSIAEVIEALVTAYVDDEIEFEKKTTYNIRRTNN